MSWQTKYKQLDAEINAEYREACVDSFKNNNQLMFSMFVMECFNRGIAPNLYVHDDMNRAMAGLTEEEANAMRRKFRKIWRKLVKENIRASRQRKRKIKKQNKRPLPQEVKRSRMFVDQKNTTPIHEMMYKRKFLVRSYLLLSAEQRVQEILKNEYNVLVAKVNDE